VDEAEVSARYAAFGDKGPAVEGRRLTIMPSRDEVESGETLRVYHVCEAVEPGIALYVMGPKPVYGEYVDDVLATAPPPSGEDPFVPASYDGRVLEGPGIDTNYEVTEYRFDAGERRIQWRPGTNASNELRIRVSDA